MYICIFIYNIYIDLHYRYRYIDIQIYRYIYIQIQSICMYVHNIFIYIYICMYICIYIYMLYIYNIYTYKYIYMKVHLRCLNGLSIYLCYAQLLGTANQRCHWENKISCKYGDIYLSRWERSHEALGSFSDGCGLCLQKGEEGSIFLILYISRCTKVKPLFFIICLVF